MKLEHVALNVPDPAAMADWYADHLGMDIVLRVDGPPHTRFLRDSGGRMMLEIYNNPPDRVPDYRAADPLLFHLAFVSTDPAADRDRLLAAGAETVTEDRPDEASLIVTMRDPWGVPFQFCRRGTGLLDPAG